MSVFGGISTCVKNFCGEMTTKKLIIIGIITLIVVVGGYFFTNKFLLSKKRDGFKDNSTFDEGNDDESDKEAEIMLFYVDWCPHCKTAKPEWEASMKDMDGKVINGYRVQFTEVNCTDESAEVQAMVEKFNIEGYPTIKLIKGDQVIDFEAKPTKDTITQFLNTAL